MNQVLKAKREKKIRFKKKNKKNDSNKPISLDDKMPLGKLNFSKYKKNKVKVMVGSVKK